MSARAQTRAGEQAGARDGERPKQARGRVPAQREAAVDGPRQRPSAAHAHRQAARREPVTLTGRGGLVVLYLAGLLGGLVADWSGTALLTGAVFVVGCAVAALFTRPADLLTLAVSPPLAYLAAVATVALVGGLTDGSVLRAMTIGLLALLAATAPWLFAGTVLLLAIATPRGLADRVREMREKLAGLRQFHEEENADPVRWDDTGGRV